jgi:transposase
MGREPSTITSPYAPELDEVRAWLVKMVKAMKLVELVTAVLALIARMRDINTELAKRLADHRRKRPPAESLRRVERQLVLSFPELMMQSSGTPKTPKKRGSRKGLHPGRGALPKHLERVPELNQVPHDMRICPLCGAEMTTVGHSSCEILDVRPAELYVRQRFDERVACPNDDTILTAPTPPAIVQGGKLGDRLIIEALADKYLLSLPVERQCSHWSGTGTDIAPQTLGRGVASAIDLLRPIAKMIEERTRGPGLLATDATGIPVLDRDAPDGIRTGTMWCWTNARWVAFFYSAQGDSDSVRRFLSPQAEDDAKAYCRTVQCDGTNLTTFIERAGGKRPGCWSHGRRRLVEAARAGDKIAMGGLRKIQGLFMVERASTLAGDNAAERLARRREHSAPIIAEIRAWLDLQRANAPPKTPLGQALGYLHRQWPRLVLFLEDGNVELTNNRRERELRKLVLGRRNWLFTWEDLGGERTAAIFTIVGTCVSHGINARAYLHLAAKLIVNGWPQAELRELLPDRMAALHPELLVRTAAAPEMLGAADPPRLPTAKSSA